MADFIIVAVIIGLVGAAVNYIRKAKKSGVKCIGCPAAGTCSHAQNQASGCSCGCGGSCDNK